MPYYNFDEELFLHILLRVCCAAFCGALIGFERDVHGRAAGLRTHTLVSVGSAVFTIASIMVVSNSLDVSKLAVTDGDPGRIAAQIVSGIGFLGAGTIVKAGFTVKGLTTAACLWFAAAAGMMCGINECITAIIITMISLFFIFAGKRVERKLHRLYPFQLIIDSPDYETILGIKEHIKKDPKNVITSLNITVNNESNQVKAYFFIDASRKTGQPLACLDLTQAILKQFPNIINITYKCEG